MANKQVNTSLLFLKKLASLPAFFKKERVSLLSWIIIPIFVVWLATNYIIGAMKHPTWEARLLEQQNTDIINSRVNATQTQHPESQTVQKFHWKGTGAITLWFDDAWLSQYTVAFPILEERGLTASLAVPTRLIGDDAYMSWAQIKRLQYKGWEIDSHSRNHICKIDKLKPEQIISEIAGAKQDLEAQGIYPDNYVTPCGVESKFVNDTIKRNYLSLRTSSQGFNDLPVKNPYHILTYAIENTTTSDDVRQQIQTAKDEHKWLILMFHQVDNENSEFSVSPQEFTQMVNIVKESGLPLVLPTQILQQFIDDTPGGSNQ